MDVVKLLEGRDGFSSKENFIFHICLHSHLVLESSVFIEFSRNAARAYKCQLTYSIHYEFAVSTEFMREYHYSSVASI